MLAGVPAVASLAACVGPAISDDQAVSESVVYPLNLLVTDRSAVQRQVRDVIDLVNERGGTELWHAAREAEGRTDLPENMKRVPIHEEIEKLRYDALVDKHTALNHWSFRWLYMANTAFIFPLFFTTTLPFELLNKSCQYYSMLRKNKVEKPCSL